MLSGKGEGGRNRHHTGCNSLAFGHESERGGNDKRLSIYYSDIFACKIDNINTNNITTTARASLTARPCVRQDTSRRMINFLAKTKRDEFETNSRLMKDVFFSCDFVVVALEALQLYRSAALGVAGIVPVISSIPFRAMSAFLVVTC